MTHPFTELSTILFSILPWILFVTIIWILYFTINTELANKVLEHIKDKTKCYKKVYLPWMRPMIEFFGNRYLHEITPSLIEQYVKGKKDEISVSYANRVIRVLKRAFNLAIQWGLTKTNPVNSIEFYKQQKGRIRYLTLDEMKRLLNCCSGYLREIVLTALHTGMRKTC